MDGVKERKLDHVLGVENQHESVALARVICPFAEQATDEQMLLCVAVVEAKGDMKCVADELGLTLAGVRRHLQSKLSERILKALAKNRLGGIGYLKAVCALEDVAGAESQTGNARRQAAEAIIKLADADQNAGNDKAGNQLDLNTMTLAQLQAFVNSVKQDLMRIPLQSPPTIIEG